MYKPIFMGDIEKFKRGMEVLLKNPDYSVGMTPSEVIYTENKMKVLHYIPTVEKTHHTPILIVYALVNRYYILDLQPDKSVIKRLLDEGFDVYLIDWGYPSGLDKYLTLDDYVNGYINTAVDKVRERKGVDKITLFGVCQGGTFSVMYAALHPEKVKNLITLVAPFDFDTDEGILFAWSKSLDVDKIVDYYGIVPGDILNIGFLLADPCRTMIDKYIGLFERMECDDDEECELRNEETMKNFLRMEKWIFDSPSQAGEAYRQFLKDCYQKNLLIKNEMMLGGKTINLKNITMPLLNMMGKFDHLVPNEASKPLSDVVSSDDKTTLVISTGHAGMFVGSKSQKEVCPTIVEWLKPKSLPDQTGEEKPKEVEEKPKEVEEKPKEVEEKPKEVEEKPKEVEEKPKEVEEKPKEVEENPAKENIEQRRKRRV